MLTQFNTPAPLIQAENPANVDTCPMDQPEPLPEHFPEDAFQAVSTDVPTEPKPKRKRKNARVRFFSTLTITFLAEHISFISQN